MRAKTLSFPLFFYIIVIFLPPTRVRGILRVVVLYYILLDDYSLCVDCRNNMITRVALLRLLYGDYVMSTRRHEDSTAVHFSCFLQKIIVIKYA
jgi:hypothetical protein